MNLIVILIYLLLAGVSGAAVYEFILWRRKKKYRQFLQLVENGTLEEMPVKYVKEPTRLVGFVYFIAVVGIGFLVLSALILVAFGACLAVVSTSGLY